MIATQRTAKARKEPSYPAKMFEAYFEEQQVKKILDYGCGKGRDVDALVEWGYDAVGYDPNFKPEAPNGKFDAVMLNYVLCVLPSLRSRKLVLKNAISYLPVINGRHNGLLGIAVRPISNIKSEAKKGDWKPHKDGYLTNAGTFQRGYELYEVFNMIAMYAPYDIVDVWHTSWSLSVLVYVGAYPNPYGPVHHDLIAVALKSKGKVWLRNRGVTEVSVDGDHKSSRSRTRMATRNT